MPEPIVEKFRIPIGSDEEFIEVQHDFTAAGATDPKRLIGKVVLAFTGDATEAVIRVERASTLIAKPASSNAYWAPVDESPFDVTIDPSNGAAMVFYEEPTVGWWRVRVFSVTGGTLTINLSGTDA